MNSSGVRESLFERVKPLVKDKPVDKQHRDAIALIRSEVRRDVATMKNVVRSKYDSALVRIRSRIRDSTLSQVDLRSTEVPNGRNIGDSY